MSTKKPKKTGSDRARELREKHPDWSLQDIATKAGISKQAVAKALAAKMPGMVGRPVKDPAARVRALEKALALAKAKRDASDD